MTQTFTFAPLENLEVYSHLYRIENSLRELIVEELSRAAGAKWYKARLAQSALEKYVISIDTEKRTRWATLVPHHPIYYIDFSHLRETLIREDNWKDAFKRIFVRKDLIASTLSELEFIRNKIAHNRKATAADVSIARASLQKLTQAIGAERIEELSVRCTEANDLTVQLSRVRHEMKSSFNCILKLEPIPPVPSWNEVKDTWWFDETYLGEDLSAVEVFFGLVGTYAALPRKRGTGHVIESWVGSVDIKKSFDDAEEAFSRLLSH